MAAKELTKKEIIMKAAVKVIAAKGYHSCRTLDISTEAGVAYGSLYQYFKSKEDILLSIFQDTWNRMIHKINTLNKTEDSPVSKIIKVSDFIFKSQQQDPDLMKVMIMDLPRLNQFYSSEYQKLYQSFFIGIADIVADGQRRGQINNDVIPIIAAFAIFGAVDNAIRQHVFSDSGFESVRFSIAQARDQIAKLLIPRYLAGES